MAVGNPTQTSFLGGRFAPNAQGRFELPEYATGLAECSNFIPVEEGAAVRRSGTRQCGIAFGDGQLKEFWLDNNIAAVLELTSGKLRIWQQDSIQSYSVGKSTFNTIYTTPQQCKLVRVIQSDTQAFFCLESMPTYVLTDEGGSFNFRQGSWEKCDGPYIQPFNGQSQTSNSIGTVSDGSHTPTFTITDGAYDFDNDDINRAIRVWSQPPAWVHNTSYSDKDVVTYNGLYWECVVANTGVRPGNNTQPSAGSGEVPVQAWTINPLLGQWSYGYISAVDSASVAVLQLLGPNATVPFGVNGGTIDTWQLGLFSSGKQGTWPNAGCYHQGRLWLCCFNSGILSLFASMSDGVGQNGKTGNEFNPPLFSPTDTYGNVLDASGITAVVNISPTSRIFWMQPYMAGIICGTEHGELYINASVMGDPITPTTVQINQQSLYKSQNSEPAMLGLAIAFIQSFGRRVMEYVVDVFSQKFIGRHLNLYAKDLTGSGVSKIVYQEELAPVLWSVMNNGTLAGCTYRRLSQFGQTAPEFMGWHRHPLGSGRTIKSACIGTDYRGRQDVLVLLTQSPDMLTFYFEMMQPLADPADTLTNMWYADSAVGGPDIDLIPQMSSYQIVNLPYPTGDEVVAYIGGLSVGPFTVTNGAITIPWGSDPDGLLSQTYLDTIAYSRGTVPTHISFPWLNGDIPLVVGYPMTSTITLLRPQAQNELRTTAGTGLGKTRRPHMYGVQLAQTCSGALVSFDGGPAATMRLVKRDQHTALTRDQLFNGVHWDTVDGDYSLDGQMTITRSDTLPLTVCAVTPFMRTQER